MKLKTSFLLTAALAFTCTGCAATSLFRPSAWKTNDVPEKVVSIQTNQVVTILKTNTVTVFETNQIGVTVTNQIVTVTESQKREPVVLNVTIPAHQEVVPVAWVANPDTLATVNAVGSVTGPYGAIGAAIVSTLLGIGAAFKSKQYKNAAISLAQGIQHTVESLPPAEGQAVIQQQKEVQKDHGTRKTVNTLIEKFVEVAPTVDTLKG